MALTDALGPRDGQDRLAPGGLEASSAGCHHHSHPLTGVPFRGLMASGLRMVRAAYPFGRHCGDDPPAEISMRESRYRAPGGRQSGVVPVTTDPKARPSAVTGQRAFGVTRRAGSEGESA